MRTISALRPLAPLHRICSATFLPENVPSGFELQTQLLLERGRQQHSLR
jgi:hypothetical protein